MPLTKARLAKEAVRAAAELHRRAIWDWLTDEEIFAVRLPGRESPIAVSVMGASAIEFGLALFVGEDALGDARSFLAGGADLDEDDLDAADQLALVFRSLWEFPPESRRLLDLGGFRGRAESIAPGFHRKEPGRHPRDPNRDELEILVYAIRATVAADEAGELWPGPLTRGEDVLVLTVTGDARRPEVTVSFEALQPRLDLPDLSPPAIPDDLRGLPRRDVTWHVVFALAPARVEDDDRIPRLLLLAEERPEEVRDLEVRGEAPEDEWEDDAEEDAEEDWEDDEDWLDDEDDEEGDPFLSWQDEPIRPIEFEFLPGTELGAAADHVLDTLRTGGRYSEPGLPRAISFCNRALFDLLAPALATLDVPCRYEPWLGSLRLLVEDLFEGIGIFRPGCEPIEDEDEDEDDGMPELVNMDGDPLSFHVATLSVADPEAVRHALAERDDVEAHEEDTFAWVGPPRGKSSLDSVLRARIELLPGEIRLETNSEERFEEACDWLEEIPGVKFETVRVTECDEALAADVPPDDRRTIEEEARDHELAGSAEGAMNDMLNRHYMGWLDESLPMFGGRTPREMCDTEAGRRRVRRAIEEILPPSSSPGVRLRVPKEEMLRDLGLD